MYKTKTIDTVNALKLELDKKIPLKAEDSKRLQKKLRLEFNYNSNHLEGNTLTYGQTQLLLFFDKSSGDVPVSDIEEMKAHDVALSQIEEMANDKERPLTETFIKELNKTILVKPFWKDAISPNRTPTRKRIEIGQYKTSPNSVQLKNGNIHEYASPEETPALMGDLLNWYNSNIDQLHPVQLAAEFHYRFVCIHPFDDGNGRVARLIMNYILLKNNYPPVIIKSEDKESYLTALQKADTGNIESLIEYIEEQSIWSLELSLKAANGEDIDELGDIEKEIEILKRKKLTETNIFITPKVAYEIINHINTDLWKPLNKLLNNFDDFFAETKNENFVDNIKIEKTKTITSPLMRATRLYADREVTIKNYEIFGHDLEEHIVDEIQWVRKMLSLKSAKRKIDFEIWCTLKINNSNYSLIIVEKNTDSENYIKNSTTLFEIENEYHILFMSDTINSIKRTVSNHLINKIQTVE
ncbi:Fic family protein [Geofilum sp. OHC36d9]|uniref:Fic family protein n=1 Tax=Geofilum sp. OHC36d9 TaxID=3458413 RepID=UPI0040337241